MNSRNFACLVAAGFTGVTITVSASQAFAGPRDVVVEGRRLDPETQRLVSYKDLNLAFKPGQKVLRTRISYTAHDLCGDLNSQQDDQDICARGAIGSTRNQVAAAIERAKLQMAGKAFGPAIAITMVIGSD